MRKNARKTNRRRLRRRSLKGGVDSNIASFGPPAYADEDPYPDNRPGPPSWSPRSGEKTSRPLPSAPPAPPYDHGINATKKGEGSRNEPSAPSISVPDFNPGKNAPRRHGINATKKGEGSRNEPSAPSISAPDFNPGKNAPRRHGILGKSTPYANRQAPYLPGGLMHYRQVHRHMKHEIENPEEIWASRGLAGT